MRRALIATTLLALGTLSTMSARVARAGVHERRPNAPAVNACSGWPEHQERRWTGRWNDAAGWRFSFALSLRRQSGVVSGQIVWTLAGTTDTSMRARVGSSAIERVRGTVDCAAGALVFAGYELTDASLIGLDIYRASIANRPQITGQTRGSDGRWDGVLVGTERP
ncbi:MAG: hypothetical protein Q8Q09_01845 [Deltaproteobacteria bacterium]|nr:hypothetical protein [Deltaproteobacteria bacterium]